VGRLAAIVDSVRTALGVPRPIVLDLEPLHTFDTAPQPVDRLLNAMRAGVGPVSREVALTVAAVQRGRNELCSIGTIPLQLYRGQDVVPSALLRQFDLDVPNVVHMSMTVEDLVFDGIAWWQVTGQDFSRFPISVCRIAPGRVALKNPTGPPRDGDDRFVWIRNEDDQTWVRTPAALMIKFTSPNPGVLKSNSVDIKVARQLQDLVGMYAGNPVLREYFTDADGDSDGMTDPEIDAFLAEWSSMRRLSPTAWIPSTVKRVEGGGPSPKDLTLSDLWQQVIVNIANGLGVDPEDLGVSTTSRTYQNEDARRRDKINRLLSPYMLAITDRLSMGDVTPRGYAVLFDLTNYLKADPASRTAYYQAMRDLVGITPEWIAQQEGIPMSAINPTTPAPAGPPAVSTLPAGRRFDGDGPAFTFHATDFAEAAPAAPTVDEASRTITGLAVPYNAVANKYGLKYSFMPGSLEYSAPERMAHLKDHATPVGFHRSVTDSADGPVVELAVLDGPEGSPAKYERDQLLYDAAHGLYSGLSVGVDFDLDPEAGDVEYDADAGVYRVLRATWRETSTTYMPAFDDARVTKVAASRSGGSMKCPHCGHPHAPNIACASYAAQMSSAQPALPAGPAPAAAAADEYAQFQAWKLTNPGPGPAPAPAPAPAPDGPTQVRLTSGATVDEPIPYRYDRRGNLRAGSHDFSTDIAAAYNPNYQGSVDPVAAGNRVNFWLKYAFGEMDGMQHLGKLDAPNGMRQQFAITPANVANLNYPTNHPEMYVDQLDYLYPMYQEFSKGTLDTVTPFVLPKFNSSSGLVADHVSGTEPTPGAFTATAQTITPTPLSGKVEMLREVFDQGGNPQASGLIWRQMVRGWYEGIEAAIQTFLVANAASITDINLGVAATDAAIDQSLASAITALQYVRGGDRYSKVFTQIDLYQKLSKAVDTAGRPLYPTLGAMNASGQMGPEQNYLNVRGKTFVPAWATAATGTVAASSWMLDPDVVGVWLSTPQRLDLQWRVAWVDIGIWGYKALAITDFTRTRELVYDPV
jgi:hypothetical protein